MTKEVAGNDGGAGYENNACALAGCAKDIIAIQNQQQYHLPQNLTSSKISAQRVIA